MYKVSHKTNGKVYVGKSIDPIERWSAHQYNASRGCGFLFHRAIRKHGFDAFELSVVGGPYTNDVASSLERRLISEVPKRLSYNVAEGGDGGRTMTQEQLDSQYAIKTEQRDEFVSLFDGGMTTQDMANHLGVSANAIRSCAKRLGLSFAVRRRMNALKKRSMKCTRRTQKKRGPVTWTDDDPRRQQKSELMIRLNKTRGVSDHMKDVILRLYFERHMTAQEVADTLEVSKGSVRATVNRAYSLMDEAEKKVKKKEHGSKVRTGSRNSNFGSRRSRVPSSQEQAILDRYRSGERLQDLAQEFNVSYSAAFRAMKRAAKLIP